MHGLISALAAPASAASYAPFPGPFPHNRGSVTDVTIATPTTWTEATYPGRIVCLDRLDVDDVLTLQGGPWFIFVETLDFGASGSINGDGPSGAAAGTFNADYARGGLASNTGRAQGGCGGVMIFIAATTISGTAGRPISADGGDAYTNATNAGAAAGRGGQGAFSPTLDNSGSAEEWDGTALNTDTLKTALHPFAQHMGRGGGNSSGEYGRGGGSGAGSTSANLGGGGSGIGGGGGYGGGGNLPTVSEPSIVALINLALAGCLGGGGGGAAISTSGVNNGGGGGGGGAVVVWVKTLTATPTLSANGGAAAAVGGAGAAGVTYLIDIP
ncbi:MAG: hypothetical protein WC273_12865 [Dehalococcoidia bacterium]